MRDIFKKFMYVKTGRIRHVHPKDEEMGLEALRRHLMEAHGWTLGMMSKGRADENPHGDYYVLHAHKIAHQ